MSFTTPCFVRVEDPAERKKLIEWLEDIGQEFCAACHELVFSNKYSCIPFNCGTNVELFKSLAAMNDENDREQWFIVNDGFETEMVCSKSGIDYDYILSSFDYRKATADEIIEHFKSITSLS